MRYALPLTEEEKTRLRTRGLVVCSHCRKAFTEKAMIAHMRAISLK
jgi:hypothetical protein